MPIDDRIGREDRRFDFEEAARIEKLSQPMEHRRTQTQMLPIGGGTKIVDMGRQRCIGRIADAERNR